MLLDFFGCIWIIFSHYSRFLVIGNKLLPQIKFSPFVLNAGYALDMFFMLSGFILTYVYHDRFKILTLTELMNYFKKRLARVYPAYIFSLLLIVLLVSLGINVNSLGDYSFWSLFLNIFLVQSWGLLDDFSWNIPGWSISTELQMYILFPFIIFFLKDFSKNKFSQLILIAICSLTIYLIPFFLPHDNRAAQSLCLGYGILRIVPDFMMGYISCSIVINNFLKEHSYLWDISSFLALITILVFSWYSFERILIIYLIAWLITSLSLSKAYAKKLFGFIPFVFMGELSYSMYLLQFPIEIVSNQIFKKISITLNTPCLVFLFSIHIFILIILSSLSYFLIEVRLRTAINKINAKKCFRDLNVN